MMYGANRKRLFQTRVAIVFVLLGAVVNITDLQQSVILSEEKLLADAHPRGAPAAKHP